MGASEIGAISAAFYMIEAREFLYDLVEAITGARLTVTYGRLGGVTNDLPADFKDRIAHCFGSVRGVLADCKRLLERNRIFVDRMVGVGILSKDDAIMQMLARGIARGTPAGVALMDCPGHGERRPAPVADRCARPATNARQRRRW
jgi:NADH-quinone oxidoreductase subunit D